MANTIIITGAASGIGYQTALALAQRGDEIILLCRNKESGTMAIEKIITATGNTRVHFFTADLSSRQQIHSAAEKILAQFEQIDVLVNNAGCVTDTFQLTEDGIELQWAVNYLAPFLLSHLLLPALKKSRGGRIINVSSRAHGMGKIQWEDIFFQEKYSSAGAYNQSKLALVMFTYQLAKVLKNTPVTVNVMYPGLVNTNIGLKHTGRLYQLFWKAVRWFGVSAKQGAETILFLSTSEEVKQVSGKYFGHCRQEPSSVLSYNEEAAQKLWALSLEQTKLK